MAIRLVELRGTPLEMGRQYGEELREAARAMVQTRLELAEAEAGKMQAHRGLAWCLELAAECVAPLEAFSRPVYEELVGIAEATGLSLPELVIGNGWTDFRDLAACRAQEATGEQAPHECTSLAVVPPLGEALYVAQTWDMSASAGPYMVLVRRRPVEGPGTLSLTTAGCLSLIGLNEAGIAIGNTNLAPNDAQAGVHYLALIHEGLRQRELGEAVRRIVEAQRLSGHYYYLAGPDGQFCGLETTARQHRRVSLTPAGSYVHTNHYRNAALGAEVGETTPSANSLGRQTRMEALVAGLGTRAAGHDLARLLQDHEGEEMICRHTTEVTGAATLGAAVMCPDRREMLVAVGNPCTSAFETHLV